MDREHVKGAADKVKGAIKDKVGKLTGDKKLQTEGKIDKAKGSAHKVAGDVGTQSDTQETISGTNKSGTQPPLLGGFSLALRQARDSMAKCNDIHGEQTFNRDRRPQDEASVSKSRSGRR